MYKEKKEKKMKNKLNAKKKVIDVLNLIVLFSYLVIYRKLEQLKYKYKYKYKCKIQKQIQIQ